METVIVLVVVSGIVIPLVAALVFVKLWDRPLRQRLVEPVPGTVTVTAMSDPTQTGLVPAPGLLPSEEDFTLEGVAEVPGMAPYPVRVRESAWTDRWPKVGQTVPVDVERTDPTRVRIRWDDLQA